MLPLSFALFIFSEYVKHGQNVYDFTDHIVYNYSFQPFPPTAAAAASANALAGWMANAAASSSVQAAVVTASSIPVPPNQGWHLPVFTLNLDL